MKTILQITSSIILQLAAVAGSSPEPAQAPKFAVHEWGTFTSVQGADGIQLQWNPLSVAELPTFVYDLNRSTVDSKRQRYQNIAGKTALLALQRMETPVIYFYAQTNLTLDLRVDFPRGIITEWYPQAAEIGRVVSRDRSEKAKSFLFWDDLQVLPTSEADRATALPIESSGSHYYAARNTAANLLAIPAGQKREVEKFLFYRGVGQFEAPLRTSLSGSNVVQLENRAASDLRDLFIFRLHQGKGHFTYLSRLAPGETQSVALDIQPEFLSKVELQPKIAHAMQQCLAREGLFQDEARAMTDTWQDSWYGEEGLRVFYTLPQVWTDAELPLAINPAPQDVVRVMVGRAELIEPEKESQLRQQLVRFSKAEPAERAGIISATRAIGLGRFAEPAMRRLLKQSNDPEISKSAWNLLEEINRPEKAKTVVLND